MKKFINSVISFGEGAIMYGGFGRAVFIALKVFIAELKKVQNEKS